MVAFVLEGGFARLIESGACRVARVSLSDWLVLGARNPGVCPPDIERPSC